MSSWEQISFEVVSEKNLPSEVFLVKMGKILELIVNYDSDDFGRLLWKIGRILKGEIDIGQF